MKVTAIGAHVRLGGSDDKPEQVQPVPVRVPGCSDYTNGLHDHAGPTGRTVAEMVNRQLERAMRAIDYSSVRGNRPASPDDMQVVLAYLDAQHGQDNCPQHAWLRTRLAAYAAHEDECRHFDHGTFTGCPAHPNHRYPPVGWPS